MSPKAALAACVMLGKEVLYFCILGSLCGVGVGFFMFLRLGLPRDAAEAGYLSGLFLVAGIELGVSVWLARFLFSILAKKGIGVN